VSATEWQPVTIALLEKGSNHAMFARVETDTQPVFVDSRKVAVGREARSELFEPMLTSCHTSTAVADSSIDATGSP
jgi:hypothetical protein